ncbi:DUF1127 domain-containing protein [Shimia thalassica]|jgi:hypothetical protein|uniref:YjiS-like domain-containing protein n=1 Tax=Shimia thalassica TaxID=1715693 RepID=A0A0P1I2Y1_9RHOB|nr:DUF1127 domain-containing protein [Shimia thalassica]PHO02917.1 DUF1127 domain-containing protein [Rhodobacteraceae bacterium 4F10]MBU2943041.1 DUF1127 domain-containing protein [Shimia thalassica]MDO6479093.1 DUF1127 domain-containing protein [Shimia thalassica]MDO6482136.1 DUF1127 domain-containing protein [Shimia thalassica]MDO6502636.1 DUF1127 domain-containing protein [Shimia thalassica]
MTFIATLGRYAGLSSSNKATLGGLMALYRQRRALSGLDDAALLDMGLTREEASAEAKRFAWDVPANWRG